MAHDKINWMHHVAHADAPMLERDTDCALLSTPSKNPAPYCPGQIPPDADLQSSCRACL